MRYVMLAGAMLMVGCAGGHEVTPTLSNQIDQRDHADSSPKRAPCGDETKQIRVCAIAPTGATVQADGLPPGATVSIFIDVNFVHASATCNAARTRTVVADQLGRVSARISIAADDPCVLFGEMQAWVMVEPNTPGIASSTFVVPDSAR